VTGGSPGHLARGDPNAEICAFGPRSQHPVKPENCWCLGPLAGDVCQTQLDLLDDRVRGEETQIESEQCPMNLSNAEAPDDVV
jgi:hypothetical protein